MKSQTTCQCLRLLANDSSEESSSSESEWESINVQSSTLNELPVQSGVETPEMVQLADQFGQLSCKDPEEQPQGQEQPQPQAQPQPLAQIEPIAEDTVGQVVVEEIPNAQPELVIPTEDVNISPGLPTEDVHQSPAMSQEQANVSPEAVSAENPDGSPQPPAEDEKDGNYFLRILREEQARLLDLAATADAYVASLDARASRYEHALEKLRHFSGLARLLVSSKMGQFEELCRTNVRNSSNCPFPVTNNDLHGFWDMIYQQVPPLDADFAEVLKLRDNNWLAPTPQAVPEPSTSTLTSTSASTGRQRAPKRKASGAKAPERVWRT